MLYACEHARCGRRGNCRVWIDAHPLTSFWAWACELHAAQYRARPDLDPPLLR